MYLLEVLDDGRFRNLEINPALERVSGIPRDQLIGKTQEETVSEETARIVNAKYRHCVKTGVPVEEEATLNLPSGRRTFHSILIPLRDQKGAVRRILGISRDITEQKQIAAELHQSNDLLQTIINSVPTAILGLDLDGNVQLVWNPAAEKMLGWKAEEVMGRLLPTVQPEKQEEFRRFREMVRQGKTLAGVEVRRQRKDGSPIDYSIYASPLKDAVGNIIGNIAVLVDVTERKRSEEALRKSEYYLAEAQKIAHTGSWAWDVATQKLIHWSKEHFRIFGLDSANGIPSWETAQQLIHPDDRAECIAKIEAAIREKTDCLLEYRAVLPDGSIKYIHSIGHPILNESGDLVEYVGTEMDITERKLAEMELRENERKLEVAEQIANLGYWDRDFAANRVTISGQSCHILGLPAGERTFDLSQWQRQWEKMIHPDDREHVMRASAEALRGEQRYDVEYRIVRPNGEVFAVHSRGDVIWDETGKPQRMFGIMQDVTERRKASEALRLSEERFRQLTDSIREVFWMTDTSKLSMLYVSKGYEEIWGRTREELYANPLSWAEAIHPDDRERVVQDAVSKQTRGTYDEIYRIVRPDGEVRWIHDKAFPIRDNTGNVYRVAGVAEDITELRQKEREIELAKEQYEEFFMEDLTGDFICTPEGQIVTCNPAFARMFGFSSIEQALKANMETFFRSSQERQRFFSNLLRERKLEYYEIRMVKTDGTPLSIIGNISGQFDQNNRLVHLKGYLIDDTKRRELEEQLQQRQRLESLGTLASGIAHDFNNILGIIIGHLTLLERIYPKHENAKKSFDAIDRASQRGAALVKQLLMFARKSESIKESITINEMVGEIVKLIKETFPKTINVVSDLQPDLPSILADATQVHQVLLNLCVNARDAMPKGGTLSITTRAVPFAEVSAVHPDASHREYVRTEISDTGVGMDEATAKRIFEPFFTTKGVGKGTGLGLSLVHGIVESHDGFIDVISTPGVGTTFRFFFPAEEPAAIEYESSEPIPEILHRRTGTILIVEDEVTLRDLLHALLKSQGYSVITAGDGQEAVELYREHGNSILAVITDMGLPLLSGEDTFKQIHSLNPDAKVILASGYIDPENKSELMKSGVSAFIQKPYTPNHVLHILHQVVDAKQ